MKYRHWGTGLLAGCAFAFALAPIPARAALPELRLSPLKYTEHLQLGHPKIGWIEADNPTGATAHVELEVQAFRQINDRGELEYYNDERLKSAITPALPSFDLGAREAIRVKFTIDPNRLGPGGAYGVIFLRVSSGNPAASQINTTARIGTLLILDVAGGGTKSGYITSLAVAGFVYGSRPVLPVDFSYTNTGKGAAALAFAPDLKATLGWFGKAQHFTGPFVFPDRKRSAQIKVALGDRFGPTRLSIQDTSGRSGPATRWVFLVTGIWTWLSPLLGLVLVFAAISWWRWRQLVPALVYGGRKIARRTIRAGQSAWSHARPWVHTVLVRMRPAALPAKPAVKAARKSKAAPKPKSKAKAKKPAKTKPQTKSKKQSKPKSGN